MIIIGLHEKINYIQFKSGIDKAEIERLQTDFLDLFSWLGKTQTANAFFYKKKKKKNLRFGNHFFCKQ